MLNTRLDLNVGTSRCAANAVRANNIHILRFLRDKAAIDFSPTFVLAAGLGQLATLEELGSTFNRDDVAMLSAACQAACDSGHLRTARWLYRHGAELELQRGLLRPASRGFLKIVAWLRGQGCECGEPALLAAAAGGHVSVTGYIALTCGREIMGKAMSVAIEQDFAAVVCALLEARADVDLGHGQANHPHNPLKPKNPNNPKNPKNPNHPTGCAPGKCHGQPAEPDFAASGHGAQASGGRSARP